LDGSGFALVEAGDADAVLNVTYFSLREHFWCDLEAFVEFFVGSLRVCVGGVLAHNRDYKRLEWVCTDFDEFRQGQRSL
jgi:hypothetical protein